MPKLEGEIVIRWEGHAKGWRAYWHRESGAVEIPNTSHHSTEFNLGYGGSGPAALAESILRVFGGGNYQAFKWDVIARLDPRQREHRLPAEALRSYTR